MSEAVAAIHKADPAYRRLSLVVALAGVVLLGLLGWWFHAYLDRLPMDDSGMMRRSTLAVMHAMAAVLYGCAALLAGLALNWLLLGRRIQAAQQYPLPQMRLFHDMRIVTGAAKRAQARRSFSKAGAAALVAALLLVRAVLLPQQFAREHPILFDPALNQHSGAHDGQAVPGR
jgi:hypothetical protein